jgi:hypothetical protein
MISHSCIKNTLIECPGIFERNVFERTAFKRNAFECNAFEL